MLRRTVRFGFFLFALTLITAAAWAGGDKDKGKEVIIGNFWGDWNVNTFKPNSEYDELQLEWRKSIAKEHGISITEKQVANWFTMLQTITTSVMAGKPAAQAFWVAADWAMALQRQGLLAPLSDSKAVNLKNTTHVAHKQLGYNQELASTFTFGGKQYALAIGTGESRHSVGVYFNKRLFKEAGIDPELPYNMQKAGTWTWDAYYDLCKKLTRDRNNTGTIDTWAMPSDHRTVILEAFVYSNGGEFVKKDASGKFINATDRPEFIEALNFARKINSEGVMMPRPEGDNWDVVATFTDGHVAMFISDEWRVDEFKFMADDYGYVLPPKGPRLSNYRFATDEGPIVIPATYKGEDLDQILTAVNLWFMPVVNDWKSGLYNSYRDRRAVDETITMIRSPAYGVFRNHLLIPGLEIGDIGWAMFWWGGDPSQLIESVSQNWNALINDSNVIK